MKLNQEKLDVEVSGVEKRKNFTIGVTAKAFSILSSGLYSNKIGAICRELGTNASDSHREAGKENIPFEVHLPNSLEPHFSVHDFGTGMSKEFVENLYSQYFGSSKTHSNELIGCLGLGSKSPLSYSQSFTITSWYNGKQYIYVAIINEDGIPELNKFGEFDTKEQNGVEIKFAVNQKDFNEFKCEAEKIYRWFSPAPIVKGNSSYRQQVMPKFVFEGDDWKIATTNDNYYSQQTSYAIMGNIAYPIKKTQITQNDSYLNRDIHGILLDSGAYLYFNIGELEMTASREDLEYVPKVITAIKTRLDKITKTLGDNFSKQLDNQKNKWEACIFANSVGTKYSAALFQHLQKQGLIVYKGTRLELTGEKIPNTSDWQTYVNSYSNTYRNKRKLNKVVNANKIQPSKYNLLYLNDEPNKPEVRISEHLNNHSDKTLFVIGKEWWSDPKKFIELKNLLGIDDAYFKKLSDLPLPPKKPRIPSGVKIDRSKIEAWKYVNQTTSLPKYSYYSPNKSSYWQQEKIPWNAIHVYVEINEWLWSSGSHRNKEPKILNDIFDKLEKIGIQPPLLYGIKTAKLERVKKLKWTTFEEWMQEQIKNTIKTKNLKEAIKNTECLNVLQKMDLYKKGLETQKLKKGKFKEFAEKICGIQVPDLTLVTSVKDIANMCGLSEELTDTTTSTTIESFKKQEKELEAIYPVLAIIGRSDYWESGMYQKFVDCINALECKCISKP